jgi:hypothetical protein
MPQPSFPVHLCQPDPGKSCAACCGIYNFGANGRAAVHERLARNTRALAGDLVRHRGRIRRHSRLYRVVDNGSDKRFETIFNCEFVGFLDATETRIGCLLHPGRHDGHDLRHCSFYGKSLCVGHFCFSYSYLSEAEQRLAVHAIDDWYLYGLVISDIDLVKGFYEAVSNRLGEGLKVERAAGPELKARLAAFFRLKTTWPFRSKASNRFGKYLFRGEHYEQIGIPYSAWHRSPSVYDRILIALGSELENASELEQAESLLSFHIEAIAAAVEAGQA